MKAFLSLPCELQINVMEYNPEHRKHFRKCLEKIPLETVLFKCRSAAKSYTHNNPRNLHYMVHLNQHIENFEGNINITYM